MDSRSFALLAQDGITNGAVYALLALALVLVFAVTRVIWVPSGEFVAYGTLTLAGLQQGKAPGPIGSAGRDAPSSRRAWKSRLRAQRAKRGAIPRQLALGWRCRSRSPRWRWLATADSPSGRRSSHAGARHALGRCSTGSPIQPLAEASVLVLLDRVGGRASCADRTRALVLRRRGLAHAAFSADQSAVADHVSVQSLLVVLCERALMIACCICFFGPTLYGKALRATALNRVGARLVGIRADLAGALTFTLGGLLCAFRES
jgi:branched-chain amino acid transport system permease protein